MTRLELRLLSLAFLALPALGPGSSAKATAREPAAEVAYGDTAAFWDSHTLVIGSVEKASHEYDRAQAIVRERLLVGGNESIPDRSGHERRVVPLTSERQVLANDPEPAPLFPVGTRVMLLVPELTVRDSLERNNADASSYAMMPGGSNVYRFQDPNDPRVAQTRRLCQALATKDPAKRLARIETLLRESPNQQVTSVLERSLQATVEQLSADLQQAKRLLAASTAEPRRLPSQEPAAKEGSMSGIVTVTSGRVVVLKDPEFFSVNGQTRYFRETGYDPLETTAEILVPGTAVMAVGNKDQDGEFVAVRVYALFGNVLRDAPAAPDTVE